MTYQEFLRDFEGTIRNAAVRLQELAPKQSPANGSGVWSCRQILGHLTTTLEYLIRDYLDHLKHHLDQIWRSAWPTPTNN